MSWETLSDVDMIARKAHKCIWCGEPIAKGESHHVSNGKMEGEFQSNRYHLECWRAACEYFRSGEELFNPHEFKRGTTEEG